MNKFAFAVIALLISTPAVYARGGGGHSSASHSSGSRSTASHSSGSRSSNYAQGVKRNSHGKIARSQTAKNDFKKSHPCPSTGKSSGACSGYVIDHVKPLKRGGADKPENMQWQSKGTAKQKDKTE